MTTSRRPVVSRAGVKRAVNRALEPLGARLLTSWERETIDARYHEVVRDLEALYSSTVMPHIGTRERRVDLLCRLVGTGVSEALALLGHLHEALGSSGDVCEMGIAQGATSALMANELLDSDAVLWLYDSFQGLSEPSAEDVLIDDMFGLGSMSRYRATMAVDESEVRRRLTDVGFPAARTRVVAGFIRDDLPDDQLPDEVAFAYLDFDLYRPILTGLRLMHPRTRAGSILMVDDYGYFSSGVETAVKEFLAEQAGTYDLIEPPPHVRAHFCALRRR